MVPKEKYGEMYKNLFESGPQYRPLNSDEFVGCIVYDDVGFVYKFHQRKLFWRDLSQIPSSAINVFVGYSPDTYRDLSDNVIAQSVEKVDDILSKGRVKVDGELSDQRFMTRFEKITP